MPEVRASRAGMKSVDQFSHPRDATGIRGELLKLAFSPSQSTASYCAASAGRRRGWNAFFANHAEENEGIIARVTVTPGQIR